MPEYNNVEKTLSGSAFQTLAASTGKAQPSIMDSLKDSSSRT